MTGLLSGSERLVNRWLRSTAPSRRRWQDGGRSRPRTSRGSGPRVRTTAMRTKAEVKRPGVTELIQDVSAACDRIRAHGGADRVRSKSTGDLLAFQHVTLTPVVRAADHSRARRRCRTAPCRAREPRSQSSLLSRAALRSKSRWCRHHNLGPLVHLNKRRFAEVLPS